MSEATENVEIKGEETAEKNEENEEEQLKKPIDKTKEEELSKPINKTEREELEKPINKTEEGELETNSNKTEEEDLEKTIMKTEEQELPKLSTKIPKRKKKTKFYKKCYRLLRKNRMAVWQLLIFSLILLPSILIQRYANQLPVSRKFAIYSETGIPSRYEKLYQDYVTSIFGKFGYKRTSLDSKWNVLWAIDYPFHNNTLFVNRAPSRIVNHFPNIHMIANKTQLSTTALFAPFLPKSFRMPDDYYALQDYASANSEKRFLLKTPANSTRFLEISTDIDCDLCFAQEFIDNPLLIGGRKFDFSVYAVITSVHPLRVYIYNADVLFRFCTEPFAPFNSSFLNQNIISNDEYTPPWEIPVLSSYFRDLDLSMKHSFDTYMTRMGMKDASIWEDVEGIIQTVCLYFDVSTSKSVNEEFGKHTQFFELLQFKFLVDDALKVYLTSVTMTPSTAVDSEKLDQEPFALMYDQLLYNVFNMVGIASPINTEDVNQRPEVLETLLSADKNIFVMNCATDLCNNTCVPLRCQLCRSCISVKMLSTLTKAYREFTHRGDMKRIFPIPIKSPKHFDRDFVEQLSSENQLMAHWNYDKCVSDQSWCK